MGTDSRETASSPAAGFWRRVAAFIIDSAVLGVVGLIAGVAMYDTLAQLGAYGRAVGFVVALLYFGVLNSALGRGQSLGKRAMSLRTTGVDGRLLSLPRSLARYAVLGIPFFLNGAALPFSVLMSPLACPISLVVFGGMSSILYLFVFNRRTRRSLHDYAVHSWVTRASTGASPADRAPLWRGHIVVIALLMLVALGAPLITQRMARTMPVFADMLPALAAVSAQPGVKYANLNVGVSSGGGKRQSFVATVVQLDNAHIEDEAFARHAAATILKAAPGLSGHDVIVVTLTYGYDLGLARGWRTHSFQFAPRQVMAP